MEANGGRKQVLTDITWDFFIWSRILFPNERLPHVDSDPSFDLVTLELHHMRTHIVWLVNNLFTGFYTNASKAILNNLEDVDLVEQLFRREIDDADLLKPYLDWLDTARAFLRKLQKYVSEDGTIRA